MVLSMSDCLCPSSRHYVLPCRKMKALSPRSENSRQDSTSFLIVAASTLNIQAICTQLPRIHAFTIRNELYSPERCTHSPSRGITLSIQYIKNRRHTLFDAMHPHSESFTIITLQDSTAGDNISIVFDHATSAISSAKYFHPNRTDTKCRRPQIQAELPYLT